MDWFRSRLIPPRHLAISRAHARNGIGQCPALFLLTGEKQLRFDRSQGIQIARLRQIQPETAMFDARAETLWDVVLTHFCFSGDTVTFHGIGRLWRFVALTGPDVRYITTGPTTCCRLPSTRRQPTADVIAMSCQLITHQVCLNSFIRVHDD